MGNKRRLRENKKRGMSRRMRRGRKPMSPEQKLANKKMRETQKARSLAENEAKKKASEKLAKA